MSEERIRLTIFDTVADENTRPEHLGGYLDPEYEARVAALVCKPGDGSSSSKLPWEEDDDEDE